MVQLHSNQSGFSAVEAILVLVAVVILGFTGWFVWNSQKSTDKTLSQTGTSTAPEAKKTEATSKAESETAGWLLYKAPGGEYTVRLADGWKLNHCNGSALLYTHTHTDVTPQPGTKAVVTNIDCGSDGGGDGFGISFYEKISEITPDFAQTGSFKTAAGDTVKVYSQVEDSEGGGLGAVEKGGTYFIYVITKSPTKNVHASYGVNPGQVDDHATVEKVLKTVVIN